MLDDIEIRKAFLRPDARQRIKELSLGKTEIAIVGAVQSGVGTSREISMLLGISAISVSTQLNNLRKKGYLGRNEAVAKSGGLEYEYFSLYAAA